MANSGIKENEKQMKLQEITSTTQTGIKKQLLEQSRQQHNNSVPLKYNDQKLKSGSTQNHQPNKNQLRDDASFESGQVNVGGNHKIHNQ